MAEQAMCIYCCYN